MTKKASLNGVMDICFGGFRNSKPSCALLLNAQTNAAEELPLPEVTRKEQLRKGYIRPAALGGSCFPRLLSSIHHSLQLFASFSLNQHSFATLRSRSFMHGQGILHNSNQAITIFDSPGVYLPPQNQKSSVSSQPPQGNTSQLSSFIKSTTISSKIAASATQTRCAGSSSKPVLSLITTQSAP